MTHDPREALEQIRAVCIDNADVERKDLALRFILNVAEQALTASAPKGEPVGYAVFINGEVQLPYFRKKRHCAERLILDHKLSGAAVVSLYTSPPPAQGWDEALSALVTVKSYLDDEFSESEDLPRKHRISELCNKVDAGISTIRREAPAPSGVVLADWSELPKDIYVIGARRVNAVGFDVQCCSVPMVTAPEVRYVRADMITATPSRPDAGGGVREVLEKTSRALEELKAIVWGECPSLLNEDSGGNARLDIDIDEALELAKATLSTPSDAVNDSAEAEFPTWDAEDEAYDLGKRYGYESAVQDIDIATGGDGEFKGSTSPGETVDVLAMKQRIVDRFVNASAEADISAEKLAEFIHNYDRFLAKYIATNMLHHFSIKPKSKLAIASFPPAIVSDANESAEARLREALETAAGRFNLMGGVGLVNGVDPKVGYREAMEALSASEGSHETAEKRPTGGLREATMAQHWNLPNSEPAKFVRGGKLLTCECRDCKALSAGGDGHDGDCATHNEPAYPNGPCDCSAAGGDEAKKSDGGKHSPAKDEYLDGIMEKAKISPLIEYGTGWAKIHFKRELTEQDRENIVRALKTPSDPPDRCEIVARIIDPDAYEPINEARWEGLARLESQAEAQLSAECKARKILAALGGR